jgi:2-dehydro-3-deoxyphosphogalactonate aldolase
MKLDSIKTYVVENRPPCLGGKYYFFVKLVTDDGIEGWGEMAIRQPFYSARHSYSNLVETLFDTLIKGQNPMDREMISKVLYAKLCFYTADYIGMGIISAFDLALWDIAGKVMKQPIYNLLGGKIRDKLRSYTYIYSKADTEGKSNVLSHNALAPSSYGQRWRDGGAPLAEAAAFCAGEGFTAVKFDPVRQSSTNGIPPAPYDISLEELHKAEDSLRIVRETVGDNVDILMGTHGQLTPISAVTWARVCEKYNCGWYEEPLPPENKAEMGRIAQQTWLPIASGERVTNVFDFHELFRHHAVKIAMPDLGSCGGMTEAKKIASMAEPYYIQVAPHIWGGPIITAAALQLAVNIPNFYAQESMFKSGGFFNEILDEPITWKDGYLYVNDRPGLGHNLVEKQLEKYAG